MKQSFEIKKLNEEQRLVFGWGSVAVKDGQTVVDLQDDIIAPEVLEKAVYDFVLESRESGEMHKGKAVENVVESFVSTPDKLQAMGLTQGSLPIGWWVGVKLTPEVFAKVKDGTYKGFSIEGSAKVEDA